MQALIRCSSKTFLESNEDVNLYSHYKNHRIFIVHQVSLVGLTYINMHILDLGNYTYIQ